MKCKIITSLRYQWVKRYANSFSSFSLSLDANRHLEYIELEKKTSFKKRTTEDSLFTTCGKTFIVPTQTRYIVEENGINPVKGLSGVHIYDPLAQLRYILVEKLATALLLVTSEHQPPSTSSTRFHSPKVCYQIMVWMGCEGDLKVGDSGWKVMNNKLVRVMTK